MCSICDDPYSPEFSKEEMKEIILRGKEENGPEKWEISDWNRLLEHLFSFGGDGCPICKTLFNEADSDLMNDPIWIKHRIKKGEYENPEEMKRSAEEITKRRGEFHAAKEDYLGKQ
ncbi:MAG: hypothetical protein PHG05_03170 [Candidatus Nanoarchaeia archaeon]|nr:hypothetical protein [Candidatus Nanoarchaeia archaeon]